MRKVPVGAALLAAFPVLSACSAGPTARPGYMVQAYEPMSLQAAIEGQELAAIYFVGLMACSNHDPVHTAETFEEMQELSEDPPGCTGWRFVGALASDPERLHELQTFDFDVSVFERE